MSQTPPHRKISFANPKTTVKKKKKKQSVTGEKKKKRGKDLKSYLGVYELRDKKSSEDIVICTR